MSSAARRGQASGLTQRISQKWHDWRAEVGQDPRTIISYAILGGAFLAFVVGVGVLILSLMPSTWALTPGEVVTYRLRTTWAEQIVDGRKPKYGPEAGEDSEAHLIALDGSGLVAWLAPVQRVDRIMLLMLGRDGSVARVDAAQRPRSGSMASGLFDPSLCPLPDQGSDQTWEVTVPFGLLPDEHRLLQCKVRRSRSSTNPEFTLKPEAPTVEWLERGTYRQLRDFQMVYRFHGRHHRIDQAVASGLLTIEIPSPGTWRRYRVETRVELARSEQTPSVEALRQASFFCVMAQDVLEGRLPGMRRDVLARELRATSSGVPRLQALAMNLADRLQGRVVAANDAPRIAGEPRGKPVEVWWLRVAVAPSAAEAERIAQALRKLNRKPALHPGSGLVAVDLGPFPSADPRLLAEVRKAMASVAPKARPEWVRVQ
jgi:hypothetical protein